MGCETVECPSCKIKVGAMPTPINIGQFRGSDYIQTYHLFIVYYEVDRTIVYRGGPARNNRYDDLVAEGLAQQYQSPTSEIGDIDFPFDNLVTNRMVGLERDFDYNAWVENGSQSRHMVTIAEGVNYCGMDEKLTQETRRVGMLGRTYNAVHLDRTDNSNATVSTILQEAGLPVQKPSVHAPGWGTNLHNATTLIEDASEAVEAMKRPAQEVRRQLNWFDSLSPLQQYDYLRRIFGGY